MNSKHYNIPIFIPDYGCPFKCIFCNQKTITTTQTVPTKEDIYSKISQWLLTIKNNNSEVEVAFFGGNFTGLPITVQQEYLEVVQPFLKNEKIKSIRISTRPDAINVENLNFLKEYGVKTIELGAQSMDEDVLLQSKRGHTAKKTIESSKLIKEFGFSLGLQMMIGLPGDSYEKSIFTAKKIAELKADETRIYPVLVIKNTLLEKSYYYGKYTPLLLNEAILWTIPIYLHFIENNIKVLKIGLHPSEGFINGNELIAGPYHQSFRELMLSRMWQQKLSEIEIKTHKIHIFVNPKDINYAIGYKHENYNLLKNRFKFIKIIQDSKLEKNDFYVNYL